jgi:hypothetical protein
VGLVDLDEVACRAGGGVGWYRDSLAQGGSDLRLGELQGNRGSQDVERAGVGGRITRSEAFVPTVVADPPVLRFGAPEETELAPLEPAEPFEAPEPVEPTGPVRGGEPPVVPVEDVPVAVTGSTR